ncbi:3-hydroxyisobutyrate dehydrogenase [Oceanicola granulosus HTCC2516]|uniref:3-hydroxyisobutyrate dehydrogenase n=1 Tax=Oceanicola granulosus (strain ATCC BAA-861 / DSM 15982 / KCTC 12143 / HTCC2516) TaxID=314256 RepID=Q2CA17_OCEGH|nr:3-hydroxyisobutyrate dehydrogenase [Oceanicola granulosus]EAR49520.1 3-hydroxyisobutyrate dehydrogenase [Oceanicola granulosus HTCC2516]
MKIGFIGLGSMGAPMAASLARAGHGVKGFDPAARAPEGVSACSSALEAAIGAEVVILMLPDGGAVRDVAGRILDGMSAGAVLVDCSTIDVATAREVARLGGSHGIACLDAPVTGGTTGAAEGGLTFLAGGDTDAFARVRPLFETMGSRAVHCGAAGNGQAARLCNNMILGATMIATCEAMALAEKLGLGQKALFNVVSTSSGSSWSMNTYCPAPGIGPASPADDNYRPGYAAELMLEDLRLAQAAAADCDADTPLGAAAAELYRAFVEEEDGRGKDFSAMLPRLLARGRT